MNNMLVELNQLRVDLIEIDTDLIVEKNRLKAAGILKGDPRRAHEKELILESQKVREAMAELKMEMHAAGTPTLGFADVLSTLYGAEHQLSIGDVDHAWDAISGVIDSIEREMEACAA